MVSATEHEGGKIFLMDSSDGESSSCIGRLSSIGDNPSGGLFLHLGREECWNSPDDAETTISLKRFNMGQKFTVVGVIIDPVAL